MTRSTTGLHHVTAIGADPRRNLAFYTGTLGLRLVKRTVNFDDPGTYHFYFGDRTGRPGTLLTFFPWPSARPGHTGTGETIATRFGVPAGSLPFWQERLERDTGVAPTRRERFGQAVLRFSDPDGTGLELAETAQIAATGTWSTNEVPADTAIITIDGVTLQLRDAEPTVAFLTEALGLEDRGREGAYHRLVPDGQSAGGIDLLVNPNAGIGSMGAGTIHHIAWRAEDARHQAQLRGALIDHGLRPTPVVDRQYFESIYFREPGGALFEIATDGPGFLIDEPEETLGESLRLPAQYEPNRARIESTLPLLTAEAR